MCYVVKIAVKKLGCVEEGMRRMVGVVTCIVIGRKRRIGRIDLMKYLKPRSAGLRVELK